jgi:hypothetical protein
MIRNSTPRRARLAALGLLVPAALVGFIPSAQAALAQPTLTAVSGGPYAPGVAFGDTATLAGLVNTTNPPPAGATPAGGTVTFQLFGTPTCNGPSLFTNIVPVAGSGTYTTSATYTPPGAGTYYWVVTYSGDPNNFGAVSPCGAETTIVNPVDPIFTTQPTTPGA